MEQQLFTHDGWDQDGTMAFTFYNVVTLVELPGIPKGSKFGAADIGYSNGILQFWDNDGANVLHTFQLKLQVEV